LENIFLLSFYLLLLIVPLLLPLLAVSGLKHEASIIITSWIFYKAIESFIFLIPSFLIEYLLGPSQALIINIYFISLTNFIISFVFLFIINFAKKRSLNTIGDDFWSQGIQFRERYILFGAFTLFVLYVILTNGNAITNPRIAYQDYRKGIGFLWAGYIYLSTLWVIIRVVNGRSLLLTFFIYILFCYFSGSKGLLVASILPFVANPRMSRKKRIHILLIFLPIALLGFFVLFDQFSADAGDVFIRLGSYFNMFQLSTKVFDDYLSGGLNFLYGEIFFSNIWQFVPRLLYADKPYAWGGSYLVEFYYPGMAETGHTPSFGMYTQSFVDFGFFGVLGELLSIRLIIEFISVYFVARCQNNNFKIYFLSFMTLIGVGAFFHVPVMVVLFLTYLLLNFRKPDSRFKLRRI
jgi:hypothetical protein